ncbi:MAG: multidrug efflux MFS transporter [Clostridiales Family XIII bacterium]|jgi:EmrB/QacA subfamily drug resistance transporter|nr:multidrug efflux MFS transporter [Clostridiales Family XIII bacterium]
MSDTGKEKNTQRLPAKDKLIVAIIMIGGFITVLNQTVMSPSLPTVMREFSINASVGQWLTSIFLLVNGLMVPVTAWLIGRFTTRQLFTSSMACFVVGSAVAAFSTGFPMLLTGRILQALGAGIMLPFSVVVIMFIFPKEKRGFAMGIAGIVIGLAPAFGPTLAGWIVDEFGWRYIFMGIAPLALIVLIIALFLLRNIGERSNDSLDILSLVFSTLGFGGMLFGFSEAGSSGWMSPMTLGAIAVGVLFVALFVRRELRIADPMLNLRVLGNPTFSVSVIIGSIVSASLTVAAVITPIYLQNVLHLSALHSGLMLMPGAVIMAGLSPVSGALFDRFGPRGLALTGLSILTAGNVLLCLLSDHSSVPYVLIAYSLRLGGITLVNMPVNTWGLNALPNRRIPHGNAINNTARQVAGSMGTAVLVTVMMVTAAAHANPDSPGAIVSGINAAFLGSSILTSAALILSILRVGVEK